MPAPERHLADLGADLPLGPLRRLELRNPQHRDLEQIDGPCFGNGCRQ
jgi:hypothetical protein